MSRRDPAAPLVRALIADAAAAGCPACAVTTATTDWSSATFTGARHRIVLSAPPGAALAGWLRRLPGATLSLPRQLLGELAIDRIDRAGPEHRIALSALTLDDR